MDRLLSVDRAQGRFDDGHGILGHQSQAKAKEGRLGLAQGLDFTGQRFRQLLQHRVDRPTLAVTRCQLWALPCRIGTLLKRWIAVSPSRGGFSQATVMRRSGTGSPWAVTSPLFCS